ncbi:unnamed protein product [Prunus armeniaca]
MFCRYHQHNSHNIEECISLRKIDERFIREGKLDQYIARPPQAPVPNVNRQINMINTIVGGPTLAGISNRLRKQYVRVAQYSQVFGIEVNRHHKALRVRWEPITSKQNLSSSYGITWRCSPGLITICQAFPPRSLATSSASPPLTKLCVKSVVCMTPNDTRP